MSRMYNYVRSRQLEGTYPGSHTTGTWISSSMRVQKGWGHPEESQWPYDGDADHWPPVEPPGIDILAKAHRIRAYQRVSTVDDCRLLLASERPAVVAFEIDDSWFKAPNGIIPSPTHRTISGAHAVCLAGYDDVVQRFIFANSWGTSWGDAGYGYLPYEYFPQRLLEGWTIAALDTPRQPTPAAGFQVSNWGIRGLLGGVLHCAEIVDPTVDEVIAWGFAVEKDSFLDLEELFVRPNWRGRGFSSRLAKEFRELAHALGMELRAWIPHSDVGARNVQPINALLRRLGLSSEPSPVRWAAAVGRRNLFRAGC